MKKSIVKLTATDSNIFSILGKCTKALKDNGQRKEADELSSKVFECSSYDEALRLCMDYVNVR
jgi:hypothetical protein